MPRPSPEGDHGQTAPDHRERAHASSCGGKRADGRPQEHPRERGAKGGPHRRPSLGDRIGHRKPRERSAPGRAGAGSLNKTREVELNSRVAEREAQACEHEQPEPGNRSHARADTARRISHRHRGDHQARGIGGGQHASLRCRQTDSARKAGKERRQSRVERRLHERQQGPDHQQPTQSLGIGFVGADRRRS